MAVGAAVGTAVGGTAVGGTAVGSTAVGGTAVGRGVGGIGVGVGFGAHAVTTILIKTNRTRNLAKLFIVFSSMCRHLLQV
jgi:hypothetical protein